MKTLAMGIKDNWSVISKIDEDLIYLIKEMKEKGFVSYHSFYEIEVYE